MGTSDLAKKGGAGLVFLFPGLGYALYMRKLLAVGALALFLLVSAAAPALAQRDSFDPAIDTTAQTDGNTGTDVTPNGDANGGDDGVIVDPRPDTLANTGIEALDWLVVAYALIMFGAAALVMARLHAVPARR